MNKLMVFGVVFVAALLGLTWVIAGGNMGDDIVNKLAMLGAVVTATVAIFVALKYVRQMQTDKASGKLADENWDGIGEYKNELPFGWAVIFLGLNIYAMWYFLAGYPVNAYSQIGEYNEAVAAHDKKFEEEYKGIVNDPVRLAEMGESVFNSNCAACHGLQADGIDGKAANLHKRIAVDSVKFIVENGANNFKTDFPGGMPPMLLQDAADVEAVAKYVSGGFKADDEAGKAAFAKGTCAGCHGENGDGLPGVGPKINSWSSDVVASVLKDGKKGVIGTMPAFSNLNEVQLKAVEAFVSNLK